MEKYITSLKEDYMEISTASLKKSLKNTKDINNFLKENTSSITDPTLSQHLNKLLSKKGLNRKDVIAPANLDINYINQLFNGMKKKTRQGYYIVFSIWFWSKLRGNG